VSDPVADLSARFRATRAYTEALAAPLSPEDQLLQSMPACSPTKWHRAHTTWFFETFVLAAAGVEPLDRRARYLWNSYYEAIGPRHPRPQRGLLSRPSCDEVTAYRQAVDARVVEVLDAHPELAPIVLLGIQHEQQHQELILTDILHAFGESPLKPAYGVAATTTTRRGWLDLDGGLVTLGAVSGFAFDNEGPRHQAWLAPYRIDVGLVTVAALRAFIADGGYTQPGLWMSAGWELVRAEGWTAPHHTRLEGGALVVFDRGGEREAHDDEPARHLSWFEADALARWLGARLPTEAEWEHAAALLDGAYDVAWQWTNSAYLAYPGFKPDAGAIGEYNGKFMSGQMVLRGGSDFTPAGHTRASYRNFWAPETRFQRTGLRLARDGEP